MEKINKVQTMQLMLFMKKKIVIFLDSPSISFVYMYSVCVYVFIESRLLPLVVVSYFFVFDEMIT